MDLELLQQCLMVEVDHKQLYPALTEHDGIMYVQYDVGDEHLKIDVPIFVLQMSLIRSSGVIKNRCYQWYEGLK